MLQSTFVGLNCNLLTKIVITEIDPAAVSGRQDLLCLPSSKRAVDAWETDKRSWEGQAGENKEIYIMFCCKSMLKT